nr:MAG TPA: hypothetical protein [Caudoviricetes sp.]
MSFWMFSHRHNFCTSKPQTSSFFVVKTMII